MGILHFLDVGHGDCSIIQHASGRNTVIDVCKARRESKNALASLLGGAPYPNYLSGGALNDLFPASTNPLTSGALSSVLASTRPTPSLMEMVAADSATAENPIQYMRDCGISDVFRFVLTHPDMDHMDGIKDFFDEFPPTNFWDSANSREFDFTGNRYREEDWEFYKALRDGKLANTPMRLTLNAGARGAYYNKGSDTDASHDGLYILAPTAELVAGANQSEDFNDASYVILYRSNAGRILFCGDSHDNTWEHILENHLVDVENVELMIAPHHGRDSDRDRLFLSKVKPRVTLFGCGPSEHMAYDAWRNRNLYYIPGNKSGTVVVDASGTQMHIYAKKERFARDRNANTFYSDQHRAWWLGFVT